MPAKDRDLMMCPDCDKAGTLHHRPEDNNHHECYRCSDCSGEFFPDEIKRIQYKTVKFMNENGKEVYIPLTPDRIARLKGEGVYQRAADTRKKRQSLSSRDKNLLRRLRK